MTIPLEDLLVKAQNAFDQYRAGYHAAVAISGRGAPGSTVYPGTPSLLTLRSRMPTVGTLTALASELLSGSGELPDSNALRSSAMNMGVEPAAFIATLCCLMLAMDVLCSIESGESDMVSQVFDLMTVDGVQPTTWENMSSKKLTTQAPTPSPATAPGVTLGQLDKPDRSLLNMAIQRRKSKQPVSHTKKSTTRRKGTGRSGAKPPK